MHALQLPDDLMSASAQQLKAAQKGPRLGPMVTTFGDVWVPRIAQASPTSLWGRALPASATVVPLQSLEAFRKWLYVDFVVNTSYNMFDAFRWTSDIPSRPWPDGKEHRDGEEVRSGDWEGT